MERSNNVSFGSIVLAPGYHTITFKVTDDNDGAEAFGIDSFSVTPSGSTREAEDYISLTHLDGSAGVSASSGDTITKEDMIADGVWGGNYQLDYNADAIDDYITLRFYYDLWRETNFNQGSLDSLEVKFSNENGAGGASGDDDYVLCLEGNETEETQGTKLSQDITPGTGDDTTYRVVVTVPSNGMLCSIKFSAGTSAPLTIEEAYISERESGQDGGTCYPVTFSNCQLDPRNAAQGVTEHNEVAGVSYGITIPATKFGWSNSISIDDSGTTEAEFFEGDKEYFLTFYLAGLGAGESMSIAYWASGSTRSYTRSGDWAGTDLVEEDWGAAGTEDTDLYTVEEVGVSYMNEGTYTSQIYDTSMDDPQFDKIVWNIKRDNAPDANVVLRVRSNDSSDALANDSDWSDEFSVNTNSLTNGNSSISSIAGGRYVQFQAALYSYESGEDVAQQTNDTDDDYDDDEDYDLSCILEDITITWPGQQRSVDVSGYYTLKPTYGKFTVKVDGQDLNKGLETKLTATRGSYAGRGDLSCSLQTEMELRNTGK